MKVELTRRALRELQEIDKETQGRILEAIGKIQAGAVDMKKLLGTTNRYRVRVGNWRIIFAVSDEMTLIERNAHRREVYR